MSSWWTGSGGRAVVRRRPGSWAVEGGSRGGNSVTDTAQAGAQAQHQSGGGAGGLEIPTVKYFYLQRNYSLTPRAYIPLLFKP